VRLLPKFDTSINHSRQSSTTASRTSVSQQAITQDTLEVRGAWTVFDGWATKGAKLEAKADQRYWERQRQIDADVAMDEAQRLARLLDLDARSMHFAELHLAGAAGAVSRLESEQKAGTVSQSDIDAASSDLRLAKANAAVARANYLSDWSAFVSLVAEDPVLKNLPFRYVSANH
jgi:hypothetical protein